MSRRTARAALAGVTALTLALAPTSASASDDAPTEPLAVRGSSNSVGQSVQIRTDADGNPNSSTTDFRWSVTQIGAQGDPGADITVAVPEEGLLLHNLQEFGFIPQEDGKGLFDISLNDTGFGTARSVSLVPPDDFVLPVELTTEFTLDGEPILAQDLVGKDGVVTAKYTVINKTRQEITVPITSVTGDEIEKDVEADVPMVVEAVTLLPDRFSALNTGRGLGGADGRGNTQVKWISLPFAPLSKDGTASFGWAANVTNAVIPSMLVQVLPVYIPPGEEGDRAPVDEAARQAALEAVPPPDVSGDVNAIKAGVADVISGLETLTADDGGEDPLTTVEGKVNDFFTEFGTNIETISTLVDPNNPDGATALVGELQTTVDDALATITQIEESGVIEQIDQAATALTPENAALLVELSPTITKLADNSEAITKLADSAEDIQAIADNAGAIAASIKLGCVDPPGEALGPTLPPEVCDQQDKLIAILESPELQQAATILNSPEFQRAADIIASPQFAKAADALAKVAPILVPLSESLQVLDEQLPGVITTLKPVLTALQDVLAKLETALTALSTQMKIVGEGIASKNVDLPTLDAVLAEITASILASEGGQQVTSGLDQISGGIAGVKTEIGSYVAELAVALQAAKAQVDSAVESGKETAGAVISKADTLKAEVAGLVTMAHECPLPYGCDVTEAPEGTKLAGAYEFRMDPADQEAPSTLPRVLLGLVVLLVAGFVGSRFVTERRRAAAATAGGSGPGGPDASAPIGGGQPNGSDQGGSAAGLAAAGAAGAGVTAVAMADDDGGYATAAPPVDAPEVTAEAVDSAEGAVSDVADEAKGAGGDIADQADAVAGSVEGEVGDVADQAEVAVGEAADSVEGAASDGAGDAADAIDGAAEEATGTDLPGGEDGGGNGPR